MPKSLWMRVHSSVKWSMRTNRDVLLLSDASRIRLVSAAGDCDDGVTSASAAVSSSISASNTQSFLSKMALTRGVVSGAAAAACPLRGLETAERRIRFDMIGWCAGHQAIPGKQCGEIANLRRQREPRLMSGWPELTHTRALWSTSSRFF